MGIQAFKSEASVPLIGEPSSRKEESDMSYGVTEERDDTYSTIENPDGSVYAGLETSRSVENSTRSRYIRIVVILFLGITLALVITDSLTSRYLETASISFLGWVQQNPFLGVVAVIIVFTLATVLFVPGAILTIGTGFAFGSAFDNPVQGIVLASISVFCGACLGSLSSFLLGRYLFRDCVVRLASSYPVFQAVDRALEGNGLKIMILLRLSPLIPYNALDYMSGVTSIPLWAYSLALFAMLPGTVMFATIGATASSLTDGTRNAENKTVRIISLVFGVTFAVVGVLVASYYSKKELNKILATQNQIQLDTQLNESEMTELEPCPQDDSFTSHDETYQKV